MHTFFMHGVTSVRVGEVENKGADAIGHPYATRKLVIGTVDGEIEILLFSRTDSSLPAEERTEESAAAALATRKL